MERCSHCFICLYEPFVHALKRQEEGNKRNINLALLTQIYSLVRLMTLNSAKELLVEDQKIFHGALRFVELF